MKCKDCAHSYDMFGSSCRCKLLGNSRVWSTNDWQCGQNAQPRDKTAPARHLAYKLLGLKI